MPQRTPHERSRGTGASTRALTKIAGITAATAMLLGAGALPAVAAPEVGDENNSLEVMVASDIHVLVRDLIADTPDYRAALGSDRKLLTESQAVFEAAMAKIAADAPDVLLIPGDLTKDGERESHEFVASMVEELKAELPDTHVYLINGNHDINNSLAMNFNTPDGAAVRTETVTPEQFVDIYDSVYSDPSVIARYEPTGGAQAGQLSYVAQPAPGYSFIVLDGGRYSADNTDSGTDEHETSGQFSPELREWAVEQIEAAQARGDVPIGVNHFGIVEHFSMQPAILGEYLINDYESVATQFADAGMPYMFTGHMHANDIAEFTTPAGNRIVDIETGSLLTYPTPIRSVSLEREVNDGEAVVTKSIDTEFGLAVPESPDPLNRPDGVIPAIDDLTAYAQSHPNNQLSDQLVMSLVDGLVGSIADDVMATGGIREYLRAELPELLGADVDFDDFIANEAVPMLEGVLADLNNDSTVSLLARFNPGAAPAIIDAVLDGVDSVLTTAEDGTLPATEALRPLIEAVLSAPVDPQNPEGEQHSLVELANFAYHTHLRGDEDMFPKPEWVTLAEQNIADGTLLRSIVETAIDNVFPVVMSLADHIDTAQMTNIAGYRSSLFSGSMVALDDSMPPLLQFSTLAGVVAPGAFFDRSANEAGYRPWKAEMSSLAGLIDFLQNQGLLGQTIDVESMLTDAIHEGVLGTEEAPGLLTDEVQAEVNGFLGALIASMTTDENGTPDSVAVYTTTHTVPVTDDPSEQPGDDNAGSDADGGDGAGAGGDGAGAGGDANGAGGNQGAGDANASQPGADGSREGDLVSTGASIAGLIAAAALALGLGGVALTRAARAREAR